MNDEHSEGTVVCRRLHVARTREEHLECPYCFGKSADVASGDRERFCDFEPGKDPVNFGFPDGLTREERG